MTGIYQLGEVYRDKASTVHPDDQFMVACSP